MITTRRPIRGHPVQAIRESAIVRWATRASERLVRHRVSEQATVIAFNAIYAMFPLALSLTAIGGFLFHGTDARAELVQKIQMAFPRQIAREMSDVINAAGTHAGLLGVIGFGSLLWAGSNLFAGIEVSFSYIFGGRPRGVLHQRAIAFFMILTFSALLILSVAASHFAVLSRLPAGSADGPLWSTQKSLELLGGWIFAVLMYLIIYAVMPSIRLPFRALWPGAVLAGTALQAITLAFPLYIKYLAGFNRFGDTFGLMFLLLTWFYLLAFVLLAGAEVNSLCYEASARARGRIEGRADTKP
jgi:membrane protein